MKKLLLSAIFALFSMASIAQSLQTIRTYYDYGRTRVNEVYTVISGTPTKQGAYKQYNQDGSLMETANYSKNKLNGAYVQYYPDGSINISANHLNGKLHGNYAQYTHPSAGHVLITKKIYDNDNITYNESYYESGVKRMVERQNGLCEEWYENGVKAAEYTQKNGKIQGVCKGWYNNGQLQITYEMVDGFINGKQLTYYPTGELQSEEELTNGQYVGTAIGYHPNKAVRIKIIYDAPDTELSTTHYNENGKMTAEGKRIAPGIFLQTEYDTVGFHKSLEYELPAAKYLKKELKDFNRKTTYNADGTKNNMLIRNKMNQIREERYYPSGQIRIVFDYDKTTQAFTESGVLEWKIWRDKSLQINGEKCYAYEDYDQEGNVIKKGYIDSENSNDVSYVIYENGVKTEELQSTGERYEYYPTGKTKTHYYTQPEVRVGYDEQQAVNYIFDQTNRGYIEYYPSNIIKEKGYLNEKNEPVGVWYYYSDKGKLQSIKENGIERKPNSTDKSTHETVLTDLHKTKLKLIQ